MRSSTNYEQGTARQDCEDITRSFRQVDVFGDDPCTGNPVAVVLDAEGLDDEVLRRFSVWSNLSEP